MPPKRKAGSSSAAPKERPSKLAKEHGITAREEAEIREAFALFAEPMAGEKEGVIPTDDVRRAMVALNVAPASQAELAEFLSILDPDDEGHVSYEPFVAICALKLHQQDDDDDDDDGGGNKGSAEANEAFRLFVGAASSTGEPPAAAAAAAAAATTTTTTLTLAHLKRVAMTLKQDVDEALLRDMILEANGGAGVGKGVSRAEFEAVMRRAGALK